MIGLTPAPACAAVIEAVGRERQWQRLKYGDKAVVERAVVDTYHAMAVLTEETGEVAQALNHRLDAADVAAELVQVAAVALSWLDAYAAAGVQPTPRVGIPPPPA